MNRRLELGLKVMFSFHVLELIVIAGLQWEKLGQTPNFRKTARIEA